MTSGIQLDMFHCLTTHNLFCSMLVAVSASSVGPCVPHVCSRPVSPPLQQTCLDCCAAFMLPCHIASGVGHERPVSPGLALACRRYDIDLREERELALQRLSRLCHSGLFSITDFRWASAPTSAPTAVHTRACPEAVCLVRQAVG